MAFIMLISLTILAAIASDNSTGSEKSEQGSRVFRSEAARIEVVIPEGWHFLDLEAVARHRATAKLKDEEFQKAVQELASAPLMAATMHPEPYDSLNPSFQVLVRPLGQLAGATGVAILELIRPVLENAFADFELLEPAKEIELGGLVGARLMATYTVENQVGDVFPTKTVMMVVPRGSYMYQFGISAPPDGADALGSEILDKICASIRFLE